MTREILLFRGKWRQVRVMGGGENRTTAKKRKNGSNFYVTLALTLTKKFNFNLILHFPFIHHFKEK